MQTICRPALVVAILLSTSCAQAAESEAAEANADTTKGSATPAHSEFTINTVGLRYGCFYAREVTNWDALNTGYLIAYAPNRNRAFLVRFGPPSFELRSASTIAFEGRDRICGRAGERMLIGASMNSTRMAYAIFDVWQLDALTVDRLLENKKGRASAPVTPAGESPGAVVETSITADDEEAGEEGATTPDPE